MARKKDRPGKARKTRGRRSEELKDEELEQASGGSGLMDAFKRKAVAIESDPYKLDTETNKGEIDIDRREGL